MSVYDKCRDLIKLPAPHLKPTSDTATSPASVYLASLAESGRASMRSALRTIGEILMPGTPFELVPWHLLRAQHIAAISSKLAEGYKPRTTNRMLIALSGTLKAAWRIGSLSTDDYHRTIDAFRFRSVVGQRAGRAITEADLETLIQRSPTPAVAAMVVLMARGGLRRFEVANALRKDYHEDTGTLEVTRKGGRVGTIYLDEEWSEIVTRHAITVPGGGLRGYLFPQPNGKPHTILGISRIVKKLSETTGIPCTPHDLRRTFGTDLLKRGVDLITVQGMMGHANLSTTAIYDHRGDDAMREAAKVLRRGWKKKEE